MDVARGHPPAPPLLAEHDRGGRRLAIEGTIGVGARYCLVEQIDPLGPDRSRLTVRITYMLPLGLLGRVAERLGVQGRSEQEAEEILANIKSQLEGRPAA